MKVIKLDNLLKDLNDMQYHCNYVSDQIFLEKVIDLVNEQDVIEIEIEERGVRL